MEKKLTLLQAYRKAHGSYDLIVYDITDGTWTYCDRGVPVGHFDDDHVFHKHRVVAFSADMSLSRLKKQIEKHSREFDIIV